ncbi:tRNA (5-methylaminomethyl-2-thiouridine)(34)-methyltransferase MnmD [Desertivirga brevis]|uniref:tRNA (5-methylaminomethyl-2-thiouridine)(34)-methyltransferase MnmD n=1 Tax=Desertivirga brevis TaxID=2810310 RepID=UPI001A96CCFF|nr:tRNA (5-methylaminomethyl-2-thiouridine)(34)-methyltransferase MnmD [Pedobacter sp. SYSU D00873]
MDSQYLRLVETADGSKTIWNEAVGEHYHSRHGAFQESEHVFLKSGLQYWQERTGAQKVAVLEVGFGTGLNFLLTADYCTNTNLNLNYCGIEAYPLNNELLGQTGYGKYVSEGLWKSFLENYQQALNKEQALNNNCRLKIAYTKLENFVSDSLFDVLYFDAFAAVHQPEMWSDIALELCCRYLKPGGVFVTYAITGNLKRSMKALGFSIEKAKGAPGKREMLRAVKL